MVKDPVCGIEVDKRKTGFKWNYLGKRYHFCSAVRMRGFRRRPQKYLEGTIKKKPREA